MSHDDTVKKQSDAGDTQKKDEIGKAATECDKIVLDAATQELEQKVKDYEERWKRALADYANLERRVIGDTEKIRKMAKARAAQEFLVPFDHLENAQKHLNDKGLELVVSEFQRVFREMGVSEVDLLGKDFNPLFAECVEVVPGKDDGKVAEVLQKGYKLDDIIIRPAKVKVFKKGEN